MRFNPKERVYIIAEVGSNHLGDLNIALRSIKTGAQAGADAVKFQLFKLADILKDPSQGKEQWELNTEWIPALAATCAANKVDFLCTPFAPWAVEVLNQYVPLWKIGSFEYKRDDIWQAVKATGKPIIASTGRGIPNYAADVYMYCVSKYPTDQTEVALPRWDPSEAPYGGFSDHTLSTMIPAIAVARGARAIEKHIKVREQNGPHRSPDWPHSLFYNQFSQMSNNIRYVEMLCREKEAIREEFPNRREE